MGEHHEGPVELGAAMDYAEHEKTYSAFIAGTKWVTLALVALLLAMAAFFFSGAGTIGGLVVFAAVIAGGVFLLR